MRDTCGPIAVGSLERRQSMTTWGMLTLAVFVSVGMAEWSKRQAAGETVIDPAVMEQAVKMAAAAAANVNVKVNVDESGVRKPETGKRISKFEFRNSNFGNHLSDLSVSAVNPVALAKNHPTAERETRMGGGRFEGANPLSTAEVQRRGGVFDSRGNEAAKIQATWGVGK